MSLVERPTLIMHYVRAVGVRTMMHSNCETLHYSGRILSPEGYL